VPYGEAWARQRALFEARLAGSIGDTLVLVEHPPTVTVGRSGHDAHVLLPEDSLHERGAQLLHVDRGGDVTVHVPGQLVGYPILDLAPRGNDLHRYLRDLEELLIRALADLGIEAGRRTGRTGVWVDDAKIAAIGVKARRGVTMHGFALNVDNDLEPFRWIVPCGLHGAAVTSVARLRGGPGPWMERAIGAVTRRFREVFSVPAPRPAALS
jgi:lipoate-protein ligase B